MFSYRADFARFLSPNCQTTLSKTCSIFVTNLLLVLRNLFGFYRYFVVSTAQILFDFIVLIYHQSA